MKIGAIGVIFATIFSTATAALVLPAFGQSSSPDLSPDLSPHLSPALTRTAAATVVDPVGLDIFQHKCLSCHGTPDYKGSPTPAMLHAMSPEYLYDVLTNGIMYPVIGKDLSQRQRQLVAEAIAGRRMGAGPLRSFPQVDTMPGQPIESRPPELITDKPAFPGQTRAPFKASVACTVTVITDKLDLPWSLAFLPDGNFLVTEKLGNLRVVSPFGAISAAVTGVPAVNIFPVVGLLDVALDPAFAANKRIFFSYSEPVDGGKSNLAVASASFDEKSLALGDVKVIFRARPALPKTLPDSGGRIAIARDGNLFVTIGDRSGSPPWRKAQQLDTDLGKIVHITPDGAPAADNPYLGRARALPEIWSVGHRSEQGLAFDPAGRLWEHENGPRGGDELNLVKRGRNYGWPLVVHGIDYPGGLIGGGRINMPGMTAPRYYWDPVIAPSGLAFYQGNLFPQWQHSVFAGSLRGKFLDRLTLAGDKVMDEEPLLVNLHARIRDVRIGPDGAVYVLTDDTRLLKLTPG